MPLFSTTLSSVGTSQIANLNWVGGKNTTIGVYPGSSATTFDFTIQYTLDDVMRTASSSVLWAAISSSPFNQVDVAPTAGFHWSSTGSSLPYPDGFVINWPTPICGVRLNSTALSGSLILKVVQGEGW